MKRAKVEGAALGMFLSLVFSTQTLLAENGASANTGTIEAGTRTLYIHLLDDKQGQPFDGSFIGSINELKADQSIAPVHPYAQMLWPKDHHQTGFGLTVDRWTIATVDPKGGDGDVKSTGCTLYLMIAGNQDNPWVPFGEVGLGIYQNEFDPSSDWSANGRRNFELESATAMHIGTGCDYRCTQKISVNAYARMVRAEIDGKYVFHGDSRDPTPFTFPLDHIACGLGLKYIF